MKQWGDEPNRPKSVHFLNCLPHFLPKIHRASAAHIGRRCPSSPNMRRAGNWGEVPLSPQFPAARFCFDKGPKALIKTKSRPVGSQIILTPFGAVKRGYHPFLQPLIPLVIICSLLIKGPFGALYSETLAEERDKKWGVAPISCLFLSAFARRGIYSVGIYPPPR